MLLTSTVPIQPEILSDVHADVQRVNVCKELCMCVYNCYAMLGHLLFHDYCAIVLPACSSGIITALLYTLHDSGSPHNALHSPSYKHLLLYAVG